MRTWARIAAGFGASLLAAGLLTAPGAPAGATLTGAPGAPVTTASAVALAASDPAGTAYRQESVRAMTWNICGEAGGSRGDAGFCPYRNEPQRKVDAVVDVINQRRLDAVMLQEICSGAPGSHLDLLQAALGPGWSTTWAEMRRPDGRADCRGGLAGTLGIAVAVRGSITERTETALPMPAGVLKTPKLLCVRVAGWTTRICATHISHDTETEFGPQIAKVTEVVGDEPWVLLGGDFNSSYPYSTDTLKSLYDRFAECDEQAYYPGEAANEPTHMNNGSDEEEPRPATKLDYLFGRAGFTNCDSWQQLADTTRNVSTSTEPPSGISDHAPVYGYTRGAPLAGWRLDAGGGTVAADWTGHGRTGTLAGGVTWSAERAGSVALDGTGTVATAGPVVDTTRGFTLSAWAKAAPGAPISVLASQDAQRTSGFMLWYDPTGPTWRFGMPVADADGWNVDEVRSSVAARTGVWTHLVASYDAAAGQLRLYVDGAAAGTRSHTARWSATGPFVLGRDRINGNPNALWRGGIDDVQLYDYPFTAAEVAALRADQRLLPLVPTGATTVPAATDPADPGCHQNGGYGSVATATPRLSVTVAHGDPTVPVRADSSIWDNTDPSQPQPIRLGGPGSASGYVTGGGTVSVPVPPLLDGHQYGWYARAADASATSATMPVCHFRVRLAP
ncbi:LamG-like jellyroll fold domain-containing protein [Micromonospora sp. NPDC049559]|uniref:LamG-like jellyroll fold domain-containing protein n=1 Tax=Micromonospora sp. NPDC049559 TaxID=3155923 RepID=UPI00341612F2